MLFPEMDRGEIDSRGRLVIISHDFIPTYPRIIISTFLFKKGWEYILLLASGSLFFCIPSSTIYIERKEHCSGMNTCFEASHEDDRLQSWAFTAMMDHPTHTTNHHPELLFFIYIYSISSSSTLPSVKKKKNGGIKMFFSLFRKKKVYIFYSIRNASGVI